MLCSLVSVGSGQMRCKSVRGTRPDWASIQNSRPDPTDFCRVPCGLARAVGSGHRADHAGMGVIRVGEELRGLRKAGGWEEQMTSGSLSM